MSSLKQKVKERFHLSAKETDGLDFNNNNNSGADDDGKSSDNRRATVEHAEKKRKRTKMLTYNFRCGSNDRSWFNVLRLAKFEKFLTEDPSLQVNQKVITGFGYRARTIDIYARDLFPTTSDSPDAVLKYPDEIVASARLSLGAWLQRCVLGRYPSMWVVSRRGQMRFELRDEWVVKPPQNERSVPEVGLNGETEPEE